MTDDVEHPFIYLFAICISFLVRCLLRSWAHFLIGLFIFLLLSFRSSLYILDNSPLSDVSFANVFSKSVAYLLILLTLCFAEQKFLILMKLSVISFMDDAFGFVSGKSSLYTRSSQFPSLLSSRSLIVFFLQLVL
uniref:Uncharacterized protein n=1 Tax=Equus caballus TaxID=9796 RepID=A0A9L0THK7_HORSE